MMTEKDLELEFKMDTGHYADNESCIYKNWLIERHINLRNTMIKIGNDLFKGLEGLKQ